MPQVAEAHQRHVKELSASVAVIWHNDVVLCVCMRAPSE